MTNWESKKRKKKEVKSYDKMGSFTHEKKKSNACQIMGAQGKVSKCFATYASNKTLIYYACIWMRAFTCTIIH